MEPTTGEIARDLRQLEDRVERERSEMLKELRIGFADLRRAIEEQAAQRITRDVYEADQRRAELEMRQLRSEVANVRRLLISSFLAVIAAGMVLMVVGA